jgi:hypothetical protein
MSGVRVLLVASAVTAAVIAVAILAEAPDGLPVALMAALFAVSYAVAFWMLRGPHVARALDLAQLLATCAIVGALLALLVPALL